MYLPVYKKGSPRSNVAERRANIVGWVYAPFRINDLMAGILGEHTTDLSIRIYDGEEATDRALMTGPFIGRNVSSRFLSTNRLEVASHYWTLVVGSTPSFENSLDQKRPQLLAIAGVGGSFLSTLLAWLLIHGRTRALKMALKHETRYKHLMQHAADTILVLDLNQRILEANGHDNVVVMDGGIAAWPFAKEK